MLQSCWLFIGIFIYKSMGNHNSIVFNTDNNNIINEKLKHKIAKNKY